MTWTSTAWCNCVRPQMKRIGWATISGSPMYVSSFPAASRNTLILVRGVISSHSQPQDAFGEVWRSMSGRGSGATAWQRVILLPDWPGFPVFLECCEISLSTLGNLCVSLLCSTCTQAGPICSGVHLNSWNNGMATPPTLVLGSPWLLCGPRKRPPL